jgi:hypothetical protein
MTFVIRRLQVGYVVAMVWLASEYIRNIELEERIDLPGPRIGGVGL